MRASPTFVLGAAFFLLSTFGFGQTVRSVFSFSNANSSAGPATVALVQGRDGGLYGTTSGYGRSENTDGAVFKVTPGGKFTALHTFTGADGATLKAA